MEIISSTPVGRGMAAAAIYDFGDLKEYGTDNPSYVDRLFTELIGENRLNLLSSGNGGSSAGRYWEVQSLINTGNVNRLRGWACMWCWERLMWRLQAGALLLFKAEGAAPVLSACSSHFVPVLYRYGAFDGDTHAV